MIVNAQNRLEQREVLIGLESPAKVEILSGLAENEPVVIGNQSQLKPGQLGHAKGRGASANERQSLMSRFRYATLI